MSAGVIPPFCADRSKKETDLFFAPGGIVLFGLSEIFGVFGYAFPLVTFDYPLPLVHSGYALALVMLRLLVSVSAGSVIRIR
jgi:hypothetical protein